MKQTRTVLKYPGAKWRIADWIIGHMPEHKSYLEPFFGSGAVFFRKEPSRIETINDLDGQIVNLFSRIREDPERLAGMVATTPYARQEYYSAFDSPTEDPFEQARLFLLQCWQGHGFRTYCRSGWKNDVAGREYAYAVRYWNQLPEWVMQACWRLKDAQIECRPAVDVIQRFNRPDVLIYADPPYLLSTRKMKKQYACEMTDTDHAELLKVLLQHKGPVLLSGYDNDLYNDMLSGWQKDQILTTAEKGLRRTETLWIKEAAK
ncbi:DNA adenine methylase [Clostridium sp. KNHs216]|uniref:DNA adenine methylase n=1 Tax=Clostridium sp. KNHs216 TaxID=1550235 RepID=UPI00116C93F9|nr:DNA adenine methylase [Clostridium sp. KNHs216]TQI68981.1 DNA adenine methylase [Clostridium sp. KNHs216]